MDNVTNTPPNQLIRVGGPQPIYPHDYESAWRMAVAISKSGLAPRGIQTPEAIFTAMQLGAEVGLSPMSALQNIAVVNGRPTIWGDAQLALVRASGLLEDFEEKFDGDEGADNFKAICVAKRYGYKTPSRGEFSIGDAKVAGLWNKDGPWRTNPKRMLKMRARAFALRDGFTDILKGIYATEELKDVTPTTIDNEINVAPVDALNAEFIKEENAKGGSENPTTEDASVAISGGPMEWQSSSAINTKPSNPTAELFTLMEDLESAPSALRANIFINRKGAELVDKVGKTPQLVEQLEKLGIKL